MSIRVINPIYFCSESVTSLISNIFPLTEMSNFYWKTSEAWKFWSFGKKRRMELDLKCGGCGKTVTFSIFKICFTSRNVCDEALSQGRRTCLDFSFFFFTFDRGPYSYMYFSRGQYFDGCNVHFTI